jgi:hypothetical protein
MRTRGGGAVGKLFVFLIVAGVAVIAAALTFAVLAV